MSFEELSLNSFIKEIKEVTYGAHPRKFCFILGAGASRTSGIKSGQELVKIWDRDLKERNEEEYKQWRSVIGITDENMSDFYSQYYEKRFQRCPTDGYNYIEKIMESAKPSAGYVMLAHLLTTTPHNVVVTTNFDHLTEDAVNYYAQNTPLVIGHESLAHYVSGQPVRATIIKIHHDLLFNPKSRAEELEKLHENWGNALKLIFSNYHPIFIGYAGNDRSLMDFLKENSERFANDEWKYPYWMFYKDEEIGGVVKEFLEESGGFAICHNGFDEVLIQLGAAFDYSIPTEEVFLNDAKKRYGALASAIDAFSDSLKMQNKVETAADNRSRVVERVEETDGLKEDENHINQAIEKITSQSEIRRLFSESIKLYNEEKFSEALPINEKLVDLEPENALYHEGYGDVLRHLDRYEEALKAYSIAIELDSQNVDYYRKQGDLLCELNRYDEALNAYNMASKLEPEDSWLHFYIGDTLEHMGMLQAALTAYQTAVKCEPENGFYYSCIAGVLREMEKYEEALSMSYKAVEVEPGLWWNHYQIADVLSKMERYDDALVEYEKSITLNPKTDLGYEGKASILHKLGRHEEALKAIQEAITIDPNYMHAYTILRDILFALGRNEEAEETIKKIKELSKMK